MRIKILFFNTNTNEDDRDIFNGNLINKLPKYITNKYNIYRKLYVHFETKEDMEEFSKLINQKITMRTKYVIFFNKKKS